MDKQRPIDAVAFERALRRIGKLFNMPEEREVLEACINKLKNAPTLKRVTEVHWTSVQSDLPEHNETVLCRHAFETNTIVCENTHLHDGLWLFSSNNVTHWARVNYKIDK